MNAVSGQPPDGGLPRAAPRRPLAGHKGTSGRLLILAGSPEMPGAALLAARAAQRGGAGLVRVLDWSGALAISLAIQAPEAVRIAPRGERLDRRWFAAQSDQALLIGPGLGRLEGADQGLRELLSEALAGFPGPVLVDADGLNAFAADPEGLRRERGDLVITPHPGEAARLLGRPISDAEDKHRSAARELAQRVAGVCLLKGQGTLLDDGAACHQNPTGSPALSTAGSGDVLAGLLAAYLCSLGAGFDPLAAARAAAWVHGRAGELCGARLGERGTIASDLIEALPAAQLELEARAC